ncbi:hypothetical protein [Streptomyces sp. NPDC005485]|uniref:hypothetical protein n=1 Tax=Streptomyces sp. NPDC005485 TaxID=3155591 RepID=UPI00339FFBE5
MRSRRPTPWAVVRILLRLQMLLARDQMPGLPWDGNDVGLWVCLVPGCRWAQFVAGTPGSFDLCDAHGAADLHPARDGEANRDVKCPDDSCAVTTHIDNYNPRLHAPTYFLCVTHKGRQ